MSINWSAILEIVRENRGLNLSEISRLLPKKREQILESRDVTVSPQLKKKLLAGKIDLRKTVRKHLNRMYVEGYVSLVNGRYYARETPESKELIRSVNGTLSKVEPQTWSYPLAEDVAIFRAYVDPTPADPHRFDAFFADAESEFRKGLFSLEWLLVDAIGTGDLSARFYDASRKSLNMRLLMEGWDAHFDPTKVLAWTFAIDPSKLLELIRTPRGQQWTKGILEANWERILARGKKRLAETKAMKRKMRKVAEQLELTRLKHNAEIQKADAEKRTVA